MIAAIRRVLAHGMEKYIAVPEERRAMQSAAAAGPIYGAVKEWLNTPDRRPWRRLCRRSWPWLRRCWAVWSKKHHAVATPGNS